LASTSHAVYVMAAWVSVFVSGDHRWMDLAGDEFWLHATRCSSPFSLVHGCTGGATSRGAACWEVLIIVMCARPTAQRKRLYSSCIMYAATAAGSSTILHNFQYHSKAVLGSYTRQKPAKARFLLPSPRLAPHARTAGIDAATCRVQQLHGSQALQIE